jgi:histidinol phosphatase-like PHP family hydrolase
MINLHTHSTYSDGRYPPAAIVEAGIAAGLTHIGISDHYRTSKLGYTAEYVIGERLPDYMEAIRQLARERSSEITVWVGLEVDFSKRTPMEQFWQRGFRQTPLNSLDYVLFEYVNDPTYDGLPLTALLAYRRWIQVPVGLAHAHVARAFADIDPAELVRTLAENQIFLELCPSARNAIPQEDGRFLPYYRVEGAYMEAFWKGVRREGVFVSIGSDVHQRLEEVSDVGDAWAFIQEQGLEDLLITSRT